MEDQPYSNRELSHYFKDLFTRMDKQDLKLDSIEKQTFKTNGRVNKHDFQFKIVWVVASILRVPVFPFAADQKTIIARFDN